MECRNLALCVMLALQRTLNALQQITGMCGGLHPFKEDKLVELETETSWDRVSHGPIISQCEL